MFRAGMVARLLWALAAALPACGLPGPRELGEFPRFLRMSWPCPGYNFWMDVTWTFLAESVRGYPIYATFDGYGEKFYQYLYYEPDCDGPEGPNSMDAWFISSEKPDTCRDSDLHGDRECDGHAAKRAEEGQYLPASGIWNVYCHENATQTEPLALNFSRPSRGPGTPPISLDHGPWPPDLPHNCPTSTTTPFTTTVTTTLSTLSATTATATSDSRTKTTNTESTSKSSTTTDTVTSITETTSTASSITQTTSTASSVTQTTGSGTTETVSITQSTVSSTATTSSATETSATDTSSTITGTSQTATRTTGTFSLTSSTITATSISTTVTSATATATSESITRTTESLSATSTTLSTLTETAAKLRFLNCVNLSTSTTTVRAGDTNISTNNSNDFRALDAMFVTDGIVSILQQVSSVGSGWLEVATPMPSDMVHPTVACLASSRLPRLCPGRGVACSALLVDVAPGESSVQVVDESVFSVGDLVEFNDGRGTENNSVVSMGSVGLLTSVANSWDQYTILSVVLPNEPAAEASASVASVSVQETSEGVATGVTEASSSLVLILIVLSASVLSAGFCVYMVIHRRQKESESDDERDEDCGLKDLETNHPDCVDEAEFKDQEAGCEQLVEAAPIPVVEATKVDMYDVTWDMDVGVGGRCKAPSAAQEVVELHANHLQIRGVARPRPPIKVEEPALAPVPGASEAAKLWVCC